MFLKLLEKVKGSLATMVLLVLFLAASWSLFRPGFFRVHDYVHGARIAEMLRGLQDGQLPVRWSEHFGFGYGMPLYQFYAPLPYYVGAFFYWLGFDLVTSVKLLFFLCNLGTLIGAYKLGRLLDGRGAGLLLAAAYTLAPYRAVNLFVRGSLSEAWGMMALPWIIFGILLTFESKKRGWPVLVISLAALLLSHNLTALIFFPLSAAFAGFVWLTVYRKRQAELLQTIACYVLSLALSAFYWLPAFAEKNLTQIDTILSGYFHYSQHFLYIRQFFWPNWRYGGSAWGPEDDISFFLGYGQLLGLLIAALVILTLALSFWRKRKLQLDRSHWLLVGSLLGFGSALFLTLGHSQPIWDSIELLTFIQFPWRWLSAATLFLSMVVALSISLIKRPTVKVTTGLLLFYLIVLGNFFYFRPEKYLDNPQSLYYSDPRLIETNMSEILRDYIPVQLPLELEARDFVLKVNGQAAAQEDDEAVQTLISRSQEKLYQFRLKEASEVEFAIADFPGWYMEIDGVSTATSRTEFGTILAQIPAGDHQVGLKFGRSPIRRWADTISVVGWLIFVWFLIPSFVAQQPQKKQTK